MKAQYNCTTSKAKKVTGVVWLLAAFLATPTAIVRVTAAFLVLFSIMKLRSGLVSVKCAKLFVKCFTIKTFI